MKKIILALVMAVMAPVLSARTVSDEYRAEVEKYVTLTNMKQGIENTIAQSWEQMGIPLKGTYQEVADAVVSSFWTEYVADIVDMYSQYISMDDIKAINAFYESPAGRNLVNVTPNITKETMEAMTTKYMPLMQQVIMQYVIQ